MNRKTWIGLGIVGIFIIAGLIIFYMTNENSTNKKEKGIVKKNPVSYQILDDSVQVPKDVEKWLDKNKKKAGFYTIKTKKETFVLISGGTQKTTGYGISLNNVSQENETITVLYEVVAPAKGEAVKKEKTTPHMVLRFASKDIEIKGKVGQLKSPNHIQDKHQ